MKSDFSIKTKFNIPKLLTIKKKIQRDRVGGEREGPEGGDLCMPVADSR